MLDADFMSYTPIKNAASLFFFILVAKLLIKNTHTNIIKYNVKIPLKKMNPLKCSADWKKNGIYNLIKNMWIKYMGSENFPSKRIRLNPFKLKLKREVINKNNPKT